MFDQSDEPYDPSISYRPGFIVIPPIFHSLYDGPFTTCLMCEQHLLERNTPYTIQRSFVNEEPVCEFALCEQCLEKLRNEISSVSIERIDTYLWERGGLEERSCRMTRGITSVGPWLEECLITKSPWSQCARRTIVADFEGNLMKLGPKTYMLSGEACAELESLYSKKTKECLDDFVDKFLGMPSEFFDAPQSPNLILA